MLVDFGMLAGVYFRRVRDDRFHVGQLRSVG